MKKRLVIGLGLLGALAIISGVLSLNSLLLFLFAGIIPGTNISLSPGAIIIAVLFGSAVFLAHYIIQQLLPYVSRQPLAKPDTPQLTIRQRKVGHTLPPRRFHRT